MKPGFTNEMTDAGGSADSFRFFKTPPDITITLLFSTDLSKIANVICTNFKIVILFVIY